MINLKRRLDQEQAISFAAFMQHALYDPEEGYYSSSLEKIGPSGDFTTAPELTRLFGATLAKHCAPILMDLERPKILEFGPGSGKLCVDLLQELKRLGRLPETYYMLELSANLRKRQQEYIKAQLPDLAARVCWLDTWPEEAFEGIMLANEVLDAMPIERFLLQAGTVFESYIQYDEAGHLIEHFQPSEHKALQTYIAEKIAPKDEPYCSEVNLYITPWIKELYEQLSRGLVLLIDYGFPRHEYYHPDRKQGTLLCHYQHKTHSNPLIHVGRQDITAHVDFTHVAEAAHDAGFEISGYTNQASFLINSGILAYLEAIKETKQRVQETQAVKKLLDPSEMGELFKVIALTKKIQTPLLGFSFNDKRMSL